jgi:hypothetical protein
MEESILALIFKGINHENLEIRVNGGKLETQENQGMNNY